MDGFGGALHISCTCDDTNVGEVRFAVQLGKTLELVFLVKWVRYQGARGFGWARWRRHRCSTSHATSAVIWTASPRCSHWAGPYFMVFPCFPIKKEHEGHAKAKHDIWHMDSVQFTGWLQVKSAWHGLGSQWMSMVMMVSCGPISTLCHDE